MADLQPYQQRVVAERDELAERTQKLVDYLDSPASLAIGRAERERMHRQAKAMTAYGNVLAERIAHFTSPDDELLVFKMNVYDDADPMGCSRRVAMDVRQLGEKGIPQLDRGEQFLQHVFRRDFEAGDQFKGVILL